jgi:hypothetical protein
MNFEYNINEKTKFEEGGRELTFVVENSKPKAKRRKITPN